MPVDSSYGKGPLFQVGDVLSTAHTTGRAGARLCTGGDAIGYAHIYFTLVPDIHPPPGW